MPITFDIMEDPYFAELVRKKQQESREQGRREGHKEGRQEGRQEGHKEGRQEGRQEGRVQGYMEVVRALIEKRFGNVPAWADERLASSSPGQIEQIVFRLLDCATLEELFNITRVSLLFRCQ